MTVEELGRALMELPGDLEVIMYADWTDIVRSVYVEEVTGSSKKRVVLDGRKL